MIFPEPTALEKKPSFDDMPLVVRQGIEKMRGEKIVGGQTVYGSISAAASFIVTFSSGQRWFVKGSYPGEMSHGAANLRQEVFAYRKVAFISQSSPVFYGLVQESDDSGWLLGLWEYIPAISLPPTTDLFAFLPDFHAAQAPLIDMASHPFLGQMRSDEKKWRRIRDDQIVQEKFLSLFDDNKAGQLWLEKNIEKLCSLQKEAATFSFKSGLVHGDLRRDHFLFDGEKYFLVDWPNACIGPLAFDRVFLGADLLRLGDARAKGAWEDEDDCPLMGATVAGYFADQAYRAVPEKMPRLRWMQKGMLAAVLMQLSELGIIDSPPRFKDK